MIIKCKMCGGDIELYQNIVSEFANTTDETANAYISQLNQSDSGETPTGEPALIGGAYQIATGGELRWFSEKAKEIPDVARLRELFVAQGLK